MLISCTKMVKFNIMTFADGHYQAAETWKLSLKEYAS